MEPEQPQQRVLTAEEALRLACPEPKKGIVMLDTTKMARTSIEWRYADKGYITCGMLGVTVWGDPQGAKARLYPWRVVLWVEWVEWDE